MALICMGLFFVTVTIMHPENIPPLCQCIFCILLTAVRFTGVVCIKTYRGRARRPWPVALAGRVMQVVPPAVSHLTKAAEKMEKEKKKREITRHLSVELWYCKVWLL